MSTTSYTDTGLTNGTSYSFEVTATDAYGQVSGFSAASNAVTPAVNYVYVANFSSSTVSVISTATNSVVATVDVGSDPIALAITPNGDYVYVADLGGSDVSVISTATNSVVATVSVGSDPYAAAVTPNGNDVYVANYANNDVSVISTATNDVVATVAVGTGPDGLAVSPDGSSVYVANLGGNDVSVISTATNTVAATVDTGTDPEQVAVSPDGGSVYVTDAYSDVSVISTATNTVASTWTVSSGANLQAGEVTPVGNYLYVSSSDDSYGTLSVVSTATGTVASSLSLGYGATELYGVAVAPNGGYAYVADGANNEVRVISTATNTQVATVAVGSLPYSVAVSGNEEPAGTPSAPAAPDLSAAAASGQVALTWTSQPGATGYSLHQGGTEVYSGTASTYTDTGLTNGTSYDFTVTATGPGGTSSSSDTASATPEAVPAAPTLSASVNNNQQATLSWTAPTTQAPQQPVSYSVYVNGALEAAGLATTSAILAGLTNGRAYSVRVSATDGYGQASPESTVANVMASQQAAQALVPVGGAVGPDAFGADDPAAECACATPTANGPYGVAPGTGDLVETAEDISVPGAGVALGLSRTYDSGLAQLQVTSSTSPGALGYGWSYNLGMSLSVDDSGVATVDQEDGSQVSFSAYMEGTSPSWCTGSTNYCADQPRTLATLEHNEDGSWTLVRYAGGDKTTFDFSSGGALVEESDQAGDTLSSTSESPGSGACAEAADSCTVWTSSASGRSVDLGL